MIVADTDVLIDFLAGQEPAASIVARELDRGNLRTTAISRFELLAGARTAKQERVTRDLLGAVPTLIVDALTSDEAAAIHRNLEKTGQGIGMADCLIAGVCLACGAPLLTGNERHFERVPGLELVLPE